MCIMNYLSLLAYQIATQSASNLPVRLFDGIELPAPFENPLSCHNTLFLFLSDLLDN